MTRIDRSLLTRFALLSFAATAISFFSIYKSAPTFDFVLKGVGLLMLYFYVVYRIGEEFQSMLAKWAWFGAACLSLPFLNLVYSAPIGFAGTIFLLGAVYHTQVFLDKSNTFHLSLVCLCSLIAMSLKPNLLPETSILLIWIGWHMLRQKSRTAITFLPLISLLICICLAFFSQAEIGLKASSDVPQVHSWRAYTATLSLFLTAGHATWFRFYFYFLFLLFFGLFFFCTKNTPYSAYLSNKRLLIAFLFLGTLVILSTEKSISQQSYARIADSHTLYLLFVLSYLALVEEVASFAGRQRTLFLARLLFLLPLLSCYLVLDLF